MLQLCAGGHLDAPGELPEQPMNSGSDVHDIDCGASGKLLPSSRVYCENIITADIYICEFLFYKRFRIINILSLIELSKQLGDMHDNCNEYMGLLG